MWGGEGVAVTVVSVSPSSAPPTIVGKGEAGVVVAVGVSAVGVLAGCVGGARPICECMSLSMAVWLSW